jgi:hypothetical protein
MFIYHSTARSIGTNHSFKYNATSRVDVNH